jgi:hypothetical protein
MDGGTEGGKAGRWAAGTEGSPGTSRGGRAMTGVSARPVRSVGWTRGAILVIPARARNGAFGENASAGASNATAAMPPSTACFMLVSKFFSTRFWFSNTRV